MAKKRGRSQTVRTAPAKKFSPLAGLVNFVAWLTGVLVALAVGFGMTSQVLTIPYVLPVVTVTAGWIVVILTVLGVVLKVLDKFS